MKTGTRNPTKTVKLGPGTLQKSENRADPSRVLLLLLLLSLLLLLLLLFSLTLFNVEIKNSKADLGLSLNINDGSRHHLLSIFVKSQFQMFGE